MCKEIHRQCTHCAYHRFGWWEPCDRYWAQYGDAIKSPVSDSNKRPPKPAEKDCPFHEKESRLLNLGACELRSCPSKAIRRMEIADEKLRIFVESLVKEKGIVEFNQANYQKIRVSAFAEALRVANSVVEDCLGFELMQQATRPHGKKNDTVEAHKDARQAILSMMQNTNFEDTSAVGSVESELPSPPKTKRHVRGGQIKRGTGRRPNIIFNSRATKKGKRTTTGTDFITVDPIAATDTTVASMQGEISTPGPSRGANRARKEDYQKVLKLMIAHHSMESTTSAEDSLKKSHDEKANVKSFDTEASSAPSEGPKEPANSSTEQRQTLKTHHSPAELFAKKKLIQLLPGRGCQHHQENAGFEDVNKEIGSTVVQPSLGSDPNGAQSLCLDTPSERTGRLENTRDEPRRRLRVLKDIAHLGGPEYYRPRLHETRPHLDRLETQDQLHGFFGRLAIDDGTGTMCSLSVDNPLIFGSSSPQGLSQSHYTVALTPPQSGVEHPAYIERPIASPEMESQKQSCTEEKPGENRMIASSPEVRMQRLRAVLTEGSSSDGETQLPGNNGDFRIVAPPPGLGFKNPRAVPLGNASTTVETRFSRGNVRIVASPPGLGFQEARAIPCGNPHTSDDTLLLRGDVKIVAPPPGLGFQKARAIPMSPLAGSPNTTPQMPEDGLKIVAPPRGFRFQEVRAIPAEPVAARRGDLRVVADRPRFFFNGIRAYLATAAQFVKALVGLGQ